MFGQELVRSIQGARHAALNLQGPRALGSWLVFPAIGIFLVYASNFLYFFVDDEGIPFVYAQQLLNHHGLVYSSVSDGRVEGYSDFLHVLISAVNLWLIRALQWPKISVFFVGKGLALAAGMATILTVFLTLRRLKVSLPGAIAGLVFLATAGPFAVWSCSSLETVPFACLLAILTLALLRGSATAPTTRSDGLVAIVASLVVLERIDGVLYAAALIGAFLLVSPPARRTEMLWRVVLPVLGVLVVYHGWRIWYFHSVLPMPLAAKVLFKLHPNPYLLTKLPTRPYAVRFVDAYGWLAVGIAVAGVLYAAWRERTARPLLLALSLMVVYVAAVGDWMFGFRFFVPLLPLVAVLIALGTSVVGQHRSQFGWGAMVAIVIWCGVRAETFERKYETTQNVGWLHHPSLDAIRFFKGYDDVLAAARQYVPPRSLVAYNQAGFVPFMLDLHNIDNLGVTTRFYAEIPSTDMFFTEVGRYTTLTNKRSIRATDAYLLYRDVPFLFAGYNSGLAPEELMGGYYRRMRTIHGEGLYVRTDRSTSAYRSDPTLFLENLAHLSSLRHITVNRRALSDAEREGALPFFADGYGWTDLVNGSFLLEAQFAATDQPVYEVDVNGVVSESGVHVSLELISTSGTTRTASFDTVGGRSAQSYFERLDGCYASRIRLTISGRAPKVWIDDIRVQGQSAALAKYIREQLRFSPLPRADQGH